jgi:hypothetical protein
MPQRAVPPPPSTTVQHSIYDDMPVSQLLFRFLWPFWLFKNATTGDRLARAAAYRHNRNMRIYLPGYLLKWLCNCAAAFGLTAALGSPDNHDASLNGFFAVMTAGAGMAFACAVTILFVTGYIYIYLSHHAD